MRLVFYSIVLNHHQAPVADAFYKLLGDDYTFVETAALGDKKGATEDYSKRPYLLRAWENEEKRREAMRLALTADACVFSGKEALPYQIERLRQGKLSFDMSERWLKRGWVNLLSPTIFRFFANYHARCWRKKPLYKLCCSAYAAADQYRLGTFRSKCYKWGYFPKVEKNSVESSADVSTLNITPLMWCSRYLVWKHPELPLLLAARLKENGYRFVIDMYGSGEHEEKAKQMAAALNVTDVVRFVGNKPNGELMKDMRKHSIFLFTSDANEGWGAVANESMGNGCALVASEAIGAAPYLVTDGVNGCIFHAPSISSSFDNPDMAALDSLYKQVEWLLRNPEELLRIRKAAMKQIQQVWSPEHAASCLLQLIADLQNNNDTSIEYGPCSKA